MLESVLTENVNTGITMGQFLLCTITSVMLGAVLAVVHTYTGTSIPEALFLLWSCCLLWSRP